MFHRLAIPLVAFALALMSTDSLYATDGLTIELRASQSQYVLGETVVLYVTVQNNTEVELNAWVDELDTQIKVLLSRPEEDPHEFTIGDRDYWEIGPSTTPLPPGERKCYVLRLLHTKEDDISRLAFADTGKYEIFVKYPVPPTRKMYQSNTIEIVVKEPTGTDEEIWMRLNDENLLYFLQRAELLPKAEDVPVHVSEMVVQFNNSSYHSSMRWALGKYYYLLFLENPNPDDIENGNVIRKALGIVLRHPTTDWEERVYDHRLYMRRVAHAFPEKTPLDQVLVVATKQTGIPLRLGPGVGDRPFAIFDFDLSLAEFMRVFGRGDKYTWVREGDGYRLVVVPKDDKPGK